MYRWNLFWPQLPNRHHLITELADTLGSRWIGQGPKVDRFEDRFKEVFRAEYPLAVSSGTAALHLAYRLAGLGPGDRVISQVLTCTATHHALLYCGCEIEFADIDSETLTINASHVEELCSRGGYKAIVGVHLGGIPCDIDRLLEISQRFGVPVIFDAAQALGATYMGHSVCSPEVSGFATCVSFQAIKQLTTGDGGMLCVSSEEDYERGKRLRWFGIDRERRKREFNWKPWSGREITVDQEEVGYKYQMTDIEACLGLCALQEFDSWLIHRRNLARRYELRLSSVSGLRLLKTRDTKRQSSHSLFCVYVERRDDFCQALESRGVETNVVQLRNDLYSVFGGRRRDLPNMDEIEFEYIYLPLNGSLTVEDVDAICDIIEVGW